MRYFRKFWHRKNTRPKGLFGGEMKTKEEVRSLNKHITNIEQKELKEFEDKFDDMWPKTQQ